MTLPTTPLTYGTVRDWGGILVASRDDDNLPDIMPVVGTVTFRPSRAVQFIDATTRFRWLAVKPETYGYGPDGTLRDSIGTDGVKLIATDSASLSRQDWTWVATFRVQNDIERLPVNFYLPGGTTVDLSEVAPVSEDNGIVVGAPGNLVLSPTAPINPPPRTVWINTTI